MKHYSKEQINKDMKPEKFNNNLVGILERVPNHVLVFENSIEPAQDKWLSENFSVYTIDTKKGLVCVAPKGENKKQTLEEDNQESKQVADKCFFNLRDAYREANKKFANNSSAGLKAARTKAYKKLVGYASYIGIAENEIDKIKT